MKNESKKTVDNDDARLKVESDKESDKERQSRLLKVINGVAQFLLVADDKNFERSLYQGMELMAQCMNVSRIKIWKNDIVDGKLHYFQQFVWADEKYKSNDIDRSEWGISYTESMPEWQDKFTKGECVNGPLHSLSKTEQRVLGRYGIISILVIPVYIQNKFWGFVSFDDCAKDRFFFEEEVDILRSGSLMLATALDRQDASIKMREADERTRLMLDATPLCCNLWNKNVVNMECNEEAVKLFGLKDKQEYLDKFFMLSPKYQPDGQLSSEKALEKINIAFKDGREVFEWMHRKLDGTLIPSEITLVRVKHDGEYIVAGYTRDLRKYKEMMAQIAYKDKLLHTVNDVATILLKSDTKDFEYNLWQCMGMLAETADVDRVYIWKNHDVAGELYTSQLYEWSEGAAIPQQGSKYTIDIPFSKIVPEWSEILSSGGCINGIVNQMSEPAQAQLLPQGIVSLLIVPVFLHDGFWGFIGFDDCSNERIFTQNEESMLRSVGMLIANALLRNEMEFERRAAAAKMEAVITNYPGVIFSVDTANTITLFNGEYLKRIGVTPDFLEGKTLEAARRKNRHLDIIERVSRTIAEGPQDWTSEVDGRSFHAHTTPLYDSSGNVIGVVGSLDDMTDTLNLQNELKNALEKAQSASKAKSDFLSNMSHEMRTPMNAIIGMTAIAKGAHDIEKKDYCLKKIDDASAHLLGVINDILDMSKIEANKFTLSYDEFSFEKMLQKAVGVINFRLDEKNQDFSVYIDRNIPNTLIGDDQRLTQVITNLLSNATKFTPENGSIKLHASLIKQENDICVIEIQVKDNGIGMNEEQQSRLFTSFQQAESSTSRRFGGTGLGLAISKRIVEMMDGQIFVESKLGKGSCFSFTVQLKNGKGLQSPLLSSGVNWKNVRILIVDDSQEVLDYFVEILQKFDVDCALALSGEEACDIIEKNGSYDIYFVDWKMPGMNGIELTRFIKKRDKNKSVVIMISSTEWSRIEADAKNAGVDKFLPKPLFPSVIIDCIGDSIGQPAIESEIVVEDFVEEEGQFEGYCMLLAEDVEINREIVCAMLESSKIIIDNAENGLEAVKMFEKNPDRYDMIFMDIQMPEMDGLEATRVIRELEHVWAREIPIIAMTANVFKEDVEKCIASGMNDHIGKPLDFDEVLNVIKHCVHSGKKNSKNI